MKFPHLLAMPRNRAHLLLPSFFNIDAFVCIASLRAGTYILATQPLH